MVSGRPPDHDPRSYRSSVAWGPSFFEWLPAERSGLTDLCLRRSPGWRHSVHPALSSPDRLSASFRSEGRTVYRWTSSRRRSPRVFACRRPQRPSDVSSLVFLKRSGSKAVSTEYQYKNQRNNPKGYSNGASTMIRWGTSAWKAGATFKSYIAISDTPWVHWKCILHLSSLGRTVLFFSFPRRGVGLQRSGRGRRHRALATAPPFP